MKKIKLQVDNCGVYVVNDFGPQCTMSQTNFYNTLLKGGPKSVLCSEVDLDTCCDIADRFGIDFSQNLSVKKLLDDFKQDMLWSIE